MNTRLGRYGLAAIVSMTFLYAALHTVARGAGADSAAAPAGRVRLEDALGRVQEQLPGFGGMFLDEASDTLYVYSKGPMSADAAAKALAAFAPSLAGDGRRVRVLPAAYSFAELDAWRARMTDVLAMPGVVLIDVDETRNRLRLGITPAAGRQAVLDRLAALGVPLEAVDIVTTSPVRLQLTLQQFHRPLVGGLQIAFDEDGKERTCTYGFTATRADTGVPGFVTAAHCTGNAGADEGTPIYQPNVSPALQVGAEDLDPPFFESGACPAGRQCRYSDAAFVAFVPGVAGRPIIARPPLGSITWNPSAFYRITSERNPVIGETIQMVGSVSGRTAGKVRYTCVDVNVDWFGTDVTLLCQAMGDYVADEGDSGAPVFRPGTPPSPLPSPPPQPAAALLGLHSGTTDTEEGTMAVFSPIGNIQSSGELGVLINCAGTRPRC